MNPAAFRRPRRRRGGFTVVELVVAATLSAALSFVVAAALNSSSRAANLTVRKATAEQQVRDLGSLVTRYVSSAVPPGRCVVGVPQACVLSEGDGSPFVYASPSRIDFYAYTADTAGSTVDGRLLAPDLVSVAVVDANGVAVSGSCNGCWLAVSVRRATSAYVDPVWTGAQVADVRRTVVLRDGAGPAPAPFQLLDVNGDRVCDTGCASGAAALSTVALVVFDPQVVITVDGVDRPVGVPLVVAVPSDGFGGR